LGSGGALAAVTACAAGTVCNYVAVQPIDVCADDGTGCAAFNNPTNALQCPVGSPTTISATNPIGFVDASTGKDITRAMWNQIGVDVAWSPMKQYKSTFYQSGITISQNATTGALSSSQFLTLSQQTKISTGTLPTSPLNASPYVLNMFFVNSLVPPTSGTLYGFSWIGSNGIAISQNTFCPPSPLTPRWDTLAHEVGHNLGTNHADTYNTWVIPTSKNGTTTATGPALSLMTQGSTRTEPTSTSNALTQLGSGDGKGTADQLDTPTSPSTEPTSEQSGVDLSGFLKPITNTTTIGTATAPLTPSSVSVATNSTTTTAATNNFPLKFDTTVCPGVPAPPCPAVLIGLTMTIGPSLDFEKKNRIDFYNDGSYVTKYSYDTGKAGDSDCPILGTECVIIKLSGLPAGQTLEFTQGIVLEGTKTEANLCQLAAGPTTITYNFSDGLIITSQGDCSTGTLTAGSQSPANNVNIAPTTTIDPVVFATSNPYNGAAPPCSTETQTSTTPLSNTCPDPTQVGGADGDPTTEGGQLTGPTAIRSCTPSGSLSALLQKPNVTAYVPNGAWDTSFTGVQVVPIEPAPATPALAATPTPISTPNVVNSCASNSNSGQTVCTANNTDVYLLSPMSTSAPDATKMSGATASARFSGGGCLNCGVAINQVANTAVITMGLSTSTSGTGIQFLNLGNNTFSTPVAAANQVSEGLQWDPSLNLILSPNEGQVYDLFNTSSPSATPEFANPLHAPTGSYNELDSGAEDCTTGIALASDEFTTKLYIADLTQASFSPGSPGTWTAPQQFMSFPEFSFLQYNGSVVGTTGIAVAPGSHLAVVAGEFSGNQFGVVQLPATSGTGMPSFGDYVAASVPNTPDGNVWTHGLDPHTVTAYVSPNDGKAYALMANLPSHYCAPYLCVDSPPTWVAVIDMQALLAGTRTTTGGHVATTANIASSVRYVATKCGETGGPPC
jgi:hypothetical protein